MYYMREYTPTCRFLKIINFIYLPGGKKYDLTLIDYYLLHSSHRYTYIGTKVIYIYIYLFPWRKVMKLVLWFISFKYNYSIRRIITYFY